MQLPDVAQVHALLREHSPVVLGAVARRFGDFQAAEDAVQEALLAASEQWPREGLPDNPRGWLIQVAARRVTDEVRTLTARRRREHLVVSLIPPEEQASLGVEGETEQDDALLLLFMSCHPALSRPSAIALTLRAVGGLTTSEIAAAFFVPEATMAQRISRAKQAIAASRVPFSRPKPHEQAERLPAVLHVLYLIFNEGYTASAGALLERRDLSSEAIRLTRTLAQLLPDEPEVLGLLALMLLTDARRAARLGPLGELVPLDEQDRSLWDGQVIAEGVALATRALSCGAVGPYQVQAAVAALHDEAASAESTDWAQILALYTLLLNFEENPWVRLSYAVAWAMVHGPAAGLQLLAELEAQGHVPHHYRLDAVRAHLLERAGDLAAAADEYRKAAEATSNRPERNYLLMRAARVAEGAV